MVDPLSQDDDWQGYPTGRTLLLAALVMAALYLSRSHASASSREWGYLLIGGAVLGFTVMDVQTGRSLFSHRLVQRSKEPRLYWVSIAISGVVGPAAVVFSVGAMMGYWEA